MTVAPGTPSSLSSATPRRVASPKAASNSPSSGLNEPPLVAGGNEQLLTLEEAAVAAGVSVRTLARYRKSGALAVIKVGRRVLCSLDAVRDAMVKRGPQSIGRELLAAHAEDLPLGAWWDIASRLAEEHPAFEDPATVRSMASATLRRLGESATAGQLKVADIRTSAHPSRTDGGDLWSFLTLFPDQTPVLAALRTIHRRFAW